MSRKFEMKGLLAVLIGAVIVSYQNKGLLYAQSIGENVPYDRLQHFIWLMIFQIYQGSFGAVYNSICLISMLSLKKSSKMSFYSINVFLNCVDLSFCIGRVLFGSIYYHYGYIYGHDISCRSEAYFIAWSVFESILAIVGMSWVARSDICNGNKISEREMVSFIISTSIYAALGVGICIFIPYGGFEVQPSGTFCFVAVSSYAGAPFQCLNFLGWLLFLLYNTRITYKSIKESQAILEKHAIKEQAKGRYLNMVKKMEYFLHTTLNLYFPVLAGGLYQYITGKYVPGLYSAISGIIATCVPTLVNPSLFFYLNADLRDNCWDIFGYPFAKLFQNLGLLGLVGKLLIGKAIELDSKTRQFKGQRVSSVVTVEENQFKDYSFLRSGNNDSGKIDYNDVNVWLSDPMLMEAMKDHGRKEYALENFLFFDDAQMYFRLGLEIKTIIEEQFEDDLISGIVVDKWNDFLSFGNKIYTLYISVPTAPFEINISANLRGKLTLELLNIINNPLFMTPSIGSGSRRNTRNRITPLETKPNQIPTITNLSQEEALVVVEKYLHIFDECVKVVKLIIETDIWPRFRTTNLKREAVKKHKASIISQ